MEVIFRPSNIDDLEHWYVFNDDEQIFDRRDKCKKKKEIIKLGEYIEMNIESNQEPRIIKIEKGTSKKEGKNIINLVKDHRDVFSFTHDELKAYNEDVIQHTIPLKEYVKPFNEKLRQIHKLALMVQKKLHKHAVQSKIDQMVELDENQKKTFRSD
jgi:hypothetical protein